MQSRRLYLDSVAAHLGVLLRGEREEILRELSDHLEDRSMALRAEGLHEEEAMQKAVADLGLAEEVGRSLRQVHGRGTWGQALMTALPFVAFGLAVSLPEWGSPPLRAVIVAATSHVALYWLTFGIMYAVFLAGMAAGWLRNMPTWSYPYLTFWFLFTLWWSGLGSPRTIFYRWRAWIPGLALIGILALASRGFRPLITALRKPFSDWSLASLTLHPVVAFFCWASFDEMNATYVGPSLLLALLLCAAGAVGFIRSSRRWQRVAWLLGSALLGFGVTWTATTLYWGAGGGSPLVYLFYAVLIVLLIPGSMRMVEREWRERVAPD